MKKTIIAVIGENNELGVYGGLIWRLPEDLKFFREMTYGGVVIMGRKTWESIPHRPLPGRKNIVVTRDPEYIADGAEIRDLKDIFSGYQEEEEVYIIGGGELYAQTINQVDTLRLTRVFRGCKEADTFFPDFEKEFHLFTYSDVYTTEEGIQYRFETWVRNE